MSTKEKRSNFFMTPKSFYYQHSDTINDGIALAILHFLWMHHEGGNGCFPTQGEIKERTKFGLGTIKRKLKDLEEAGYLERVSRGNTSNLYKLKDLWASDQSGPTQETVSAQSGPSVSPEWTHEESRVDPNRYQPIEIKPTKTESDQKFCEAILDANWIEDFRATSKLKRLALEAVSTRVAEGEHQRDAKIAIYEAFWDYGESDRTYKLGPIRWFEEEKWREYEPEPELSKADKAYAFMLNAFYSKCRTHDERHEEGHKVRDLVDQALAKRPNLFDEILALEGDEYHAAKNRCSELTCTLTDFLDPSGKHIAGALGPETVSPGSE